MLFNSYVFILFFVVVFSGYRIFLHFGKMQAGKILLILASFYFYGFFKWSYMPIMAVSILVNYWLCTRIRSAEGERAKKALTALGCILNLGVLGYFKYTGFFLENLNTIFSLNILIPRIVLPLGISFYTFQQISFLVDCCRGQIPRYTLIDYALFVTFFPQLIAGPIVLPGEMLPQFQDPARRALNWENMNTGLFWFACGLMKKCFVADSLAMIANLGFESGAQLTTGEAWLVSLAFTFQLYYDFSGYCDMAMGIGKFFNIDLPLNFNSPYKSTNMQDFWRRWHITLGRFMLNYLYIPLGGNRKGSARTLLNLLTVFLLSGLWHGAGWLFLIWGGLHGLGILIHRLWRDVMKKSFHDWKIPRIPAVIITFFFVNIFWVFFRANTLSRAWSILTSMFRLTGPYGVTESFSDALDSFDLSRDQLLGVLAASAAVALLLPNSAFFAEWFRKHFAFRMIATILLFIFGFLCISRMSPFLYFNF